MLNTTDITHLEAIATQYGIFSRLEPQEGPQTDFINTTADITIFGGSAGGGKSYGELLQPREHLLSVPGFGVVMFRRTSKQIRNEGGLWDTSQEVYHDDGAEPKQSVLEWHFPNENKVTFAHLEHEKNKLDWQGSQIPCLVFDELTHFTQSQFWYLLSRNRSVCGVKPYCLATCNPVSRDDPIGGWVRELIDWWIGDDGFAIAERSNVKRYFIRNADELIWGDSEAELLERYPNKRVRSLTFIRSSLEDNKILEEADPDYRAALEALPDVERQQLLEGNWDVVPAKGSLFAEVEFLRCKLKDVPELLEISVVLDVAVTSTDKSDNQAITIDGVTPDRQHLYAFYSWEGIQDPKSTIKQAIRQGLTYGASSIVFETNQGGDLWKELYDFVWDEMVTEEEIDPDRRRLKFEEVKQSASTGSKVERWTNLLGFYQGGHIIHVIGTHEKRERALKRVPEYTPYDLADSAEMNARRNLRIKDFSKFLTLMPIVNE